MGGERGGICAEGRRAHHRGTCVVLGVSVPSLHTASRTSPVHVQDSSWEQDHHPLWHCLHSSCCRGPGFKGAHPHPGQHKSCPPAPACQDEGGGSIFELQTDVLHNELKWWPDQLRTENQFEDILAAIKQFEDHLAAVQQQSRWRYDYDSPDEDERNEFYFSCR